MSKKFRLLMALVLATGLLGGLMTGSTVSADPRPGHVVQIPRIDLGDVFDTGTTDLWDTKIQVQNVSGGDTGVVVFFWPPWDGTCPSNDPGPTGHACMWLPYNGVWTLHTQIPDGAQSAIAYAVDPAIFQQCCEDAGDAEGDTEDWKAWKEKCASYPAPLAVTVDRWGSDPYDEFEISSSYTGVADPEMVGPGPPYRYFAPYVMHGYNGELDTTITIQNSGQICTSCWIYYKEEGNCEQMKAQHIEAIAPGQAIKVGPGADAELAFPSPELDAPWLGSAYITCNAPMGIVVDQLSHPPSSNRATLLSMRGMPYKKVEDEWWQEWDRVWYADLLYREISGYSASIQVQNLTQESKPTFVTVDFFDQSGDEILFVGDWVCRNGSATFYLPAIIDLGVNYPFGYVGAAEIESHWQVDYPGGWHWGEPIFAVVDIKKRKVWDEDLGKWRHTVPGEEQGGAYNAHPWQEKVNAWGWAMPFIAKEQEGVTSRIAIRNNSNCNKINGYIYIKDETGTIVAYIPVPWLQPKHMKVFDLAYFGQIARGFVGAAEFWVDDVEQLCDADWDGETDIFPVMPSVVVLNYGYEKELPIGGGAGPQTDEGDLTRVYEGIPFYATYSPCQITVSGHVIDLDTTDPIEGASVNGYSTDSTGYYEFTVGGAADWDWSIDVTASKTGYSPDTQTRWPWNGNECEDQVINFELDPDCDTVWVWGRVTDKETGEPIEGAEIRTDPGGTPYPATTNAEGYYVVSVPYTDLVIWITASAAGYTPHTDSAFVEQCGDGAIVDFELHTEPRSRVLIYWGNGGPTPATRSFANLAAHYTAMGYIVDYTDMWPTDPDLEEYKLIVLVTPGAEDDTGPNYFSEGQVAQLNLFIANGGRVVVLGEWGDGFGVATQNDLLTRLRVGLQFQATTFGDGVTPTAHKAAGLPGPYNTEFVPATVQLDLSGDLAVTVGDGAFALYELDTVNFAGEDVIAVDKPFVPNVPVAADCTGWDVMAASDRNFLADPILGTGAYPENDLFATNLISFPQGPNCP